MINTIEFDDFVKLFGTTSNDFGAEIREFIAKTDFKYRNTDKKERDDTILKILKYIDSDTKRVGDDISENKYRWEKGWSENLNDFIESKYDLSKLIPKYVRQDQILRLYSDYIVPYNPNMELDFFTVLRLWTFKKYLKNFDTIYEFGCGTGYNLTFISKIFPEKELHGLDWSEPAIQILDILNKKLRMNIHGHLFNIFSPDYNLNFNQNCCALTIGTLEQIGYHYRNFLDFLINKKPKLCIHIEPIYELYNENNLIDYIAMKFHKKRNYLNNFLPTLQNLEKENKIHIIKINRTQFGSIFHDGWSIIIWRPKNDRI